MRGSVNLANLGLLEFRLVRGVGAGQRNHPAQGDPQNACVPTCRRRLKRQAAVMQCTNAALGALQSRHVRQVLDFPSYIRWMNAHT